MISLQGGNVALDFLGIAGRTYQFETSADLEHWFTLTNRVHPGGVLHLTDPLMTNQTRIYRARLLP